MIIPRKVLSFLTNQLADKEHACMRESWETFHWSLTNLKMLLCYFCSIIIFPLNPDYFPARSLRSLCSKKWLCQTHTRCDQKALPCKHWIKGSVTLFYEPSAKDFSHSTEAILYKKQTATYFRGPRSGSFLLPMKDTLTCSAWITETYVLFRAADIPVAFKTIQPQNHNDDEYENHEFHVFNYPKHYPASVASLLNRSSSAALGYLSNEVLLLRIFMLRLPEIYECLIFT